jgi:hypothetical protein
MSRVPIKALASEVDRDPREGGWEMNEPVNTANVPRRSLRFTTIDDVLAEIDRIVAADHGGILKSAGNWTPGQIMGHVAAWINYSYEGYPLRPPPWFIRFILRRMVKKYLRDGMPAGRRIPGIESGTVGIEPLETAEGADHLRRALRRLTTDEPAPYDSPAFGPMSAEGRIQLNLRHAELHLSFLRY